jgi:hypothetical protein
MTLARGTERLESARLVPRRIAPDDLPFFTRIHALPEVAQHLSAHCVGEHARDGLRWSYAISAILPQNARSRRAAERSGARAGGQMEVPSRGHGVSPLRGATRLVIERT